MSSNTTADIGIFSFQSHQNYFVNICNILDKTCYDITIFSDIGYYSELQEQINNDSMDSILKSKSETLGQYLKRIENICNSIDFLIVFPIYGLKNLLYYNRFSPNCKIIQMVYNANLWTMSNITFTPKVYKYLELPLRRLALTRIDAVFVEYTPIKEYLSKQIGIDVYTFTPILRDPNEDSNKSISEFTITVPGHIDPNRRDYETFLDTIDDYLYSYADSLNIQLLGCPKGPGGNKIINRCDELNSRGWNIDYYNEWIPISEFENKLKSSNAIVSPLKETKKVSGVTEQYGYSKASGCFGDAIRYLVPLILPAHYQVPSEVKSIVRKYGSNKELSEVILDIFSQSGPSEATYSDIANHYSIIQQRDRLIDILNLVL